MISNPDPAYAAYPVDAGTKLPLRGRTYYENDIPLTFGFWSQDTMKVLINAKGFKEKGVNNPAREAATKVSTTKRQ